MYSSPLIGDEGSIKASPDGKHLVLCSSSGSSNINLCTFDFDNSLGIISNPYSYHDLQISSLFFNGVSYSPNSQYIYATDNSVGNVYQFNQNLSTAQIIGTEQSNQPYGELQIGVDGKVYVSNSGTATNNNSLSVINYPDVAGNSPLPSNLFVDPGPTFVATVSGGVTWIGFPNGSLPNMIDAWDCNNINLFHPDFTFTQSGCSSIVFNDEGNNCQSVEYDFGDGSPHSFLHDPTHVYLNHGTYNVTLKILNSNATVTHTVFVDVPITCISGNVFCLSTPPLPNGQYYYSAIFDQSYTPPTNLLYSWTMSALTGTPTPISSTAANPIVQWNNATFPTIQVTVSDNNTGCSTTISKSVFVSCPSPCYMGLGLPCNTPSLNIDPSMFTPYTLTGLLAWAGLPPTFFAATSPATLSGIGHLGITGNFIIDQPLNVLNGFTIEMAANAKLTIQNNATITIDNSTVKAGCNQLWDKIEIKAGSHLNVKNNSIIQDARVAVYTINGGDYTIKNSEFKDNYVGVYVRRFTTPFAGTVTGTKFYTTANYLGATTGFANVQGIRIENVNGIDIGNFSAGSNQNDFSNLMFGVYILPSTTGTFPATTIRINNNKFHSLMSPTTALAAGGTGILGLLKDNDKVYVGGFGTNQDNEFSNCNIGIYLYAASATEGINTSIDIRNNSFFVILNNKATGIWLNRFYGSNFSIFKNNFDNVTMGIACQSISGSLLNIGSKINSALANIYTFWQPTIPAPLISSGIKLSTIKESEVNVLGNQIKNAQRGITLYNITSQRSTLVDNNNIQVDPILQATGSVDNIGVYVVNAPSSTIHANTVIPATLQPKQCFNQAWLKGFHIESSPAFNMGCNESHRLGKGFVFNGLSGLPASNTGSFTGNQLDENFEQLQVNYPNGTIGQQGNNSTVNGNVTTVNGNVWTWNTGNANNGVPIFEWTNLLRV
jgi:hypothetical protein